jgi:XTP/dITP diphosphohydrolase
MKGRLMHKLLIATHNAGKIREYQSLLADLPLEVVSLDEADVDWDVEETGQTFAENAILKASTYARATGLWTWADDSGLEVDALNGAPGVYSARYAGPDASDRDRYLKLIRELQAMGPADRSARFRCVVAVCLPDGETLTTEGAVEGQIIDTPRGSHGFGYDPVFLLPGEGVTMAELDQAAKNQISHRGRAARAAKERLIALIEAMDGAG